MPKLSLILAFPFVLHYSRWIRNSSSSSGFPSQKRTLTKHSFLILAIGGKSYNDNAYEGLDLRRVGRLLMTAMLHRLDFKRKDSSILYINVAVVGNSQVRHGRVDESIDGEDWLFPFYPILSHRCVESSNLFSYDLHRLQ